MPHQPHRALRAITLTADEIWDAGTEAFDPEAAAFVGNNDLRTPRTALHGHLETLPTPGGARGCACCCPWRLPSQDASTPRRCTPSPAGTAA